MIPRVRVHDGQEETAGSSHPDHNQEVGGRWWGREGGREGVRAREKGREKGREIWGVTESNTIEG